jgi:hypothetical protein
MYSARLQVIGYWSFLAGLAVTAGGIVMPNSIVVRLGCVGLALSGATLAVNVVKMLSHFARPQIISLTAVKTTQANPQL